MVFNSLHFSELLEFVLFLCVFFPVLVFFVIVCQLFFFDGVGNIVSESEFLEFAWTAIPSVLILNLCLMNVGYYGLSGFSSMPILCYVVGHQWYWSYSFSGFSYDSYMVDFMYSVDKPLQLDFGKFYRFYVGSADVIHGFSVPALGIKCDAIPGRLNNVNLVCDRLGVFSGFCTELCGVGHGFMPIVLEVVYNRGENWLESSEIFSNVTSMYSGILGWFMSFLR